MQPLDAFNSAPEFDRYVIRLIGWVLDRLCVPFLVLDRQGRILFDNPLSASILADGRHISCRDDRLLEVGAIDAALVLGNFLAALDQPVGDIDLTLPADGAAPLYASLCRFDAPRYPGVASPAPVAVLLFREATSDEAVQSLRSLHGLSEAETRVVRAVVAGVSLRDYASDSSVSIHTVRKQFNTAMQKVGVSSKFALFSCLDELGKLPNLTPTLKQIR